MPRLVYPILILNIVSANIFFCTWQGDWNGAPTGHTQMIKLSCSTDSLNKDFPPQCEHCQYIF